MESQHMQYFFYSAIWYIQHSCIVLIRLLLRKRENSILDQIDILVKYIGVCL